MINLPNSNCKTISQSHYDSIVNNTEIKSLECTACGMTGTLAIHGYYKRSVRAENGIVVLRILRLKCSCGKTHAVLLSSMVPYLKKLRSLKEDYLQFNSANAGLPKDAAVKLEEIIDSYMNSNEPIFIDFACLLCKYHDPIINSFVMVEKCGPGGIYDSRLSNGPIESINRKIKDLKRSGRGFRNFEHLRNRFLFSTRNKPVLNGSPLCSQVQYYTEDDDI